MTAPIFTPAEVEAVAEAIFHAMPGRDLCGDPWSSLSASLREDMEAIARWHLDALRAARGEVVEAEDAMPEIGDVRRCVYIKCDSCGVGEWDDTARPNDAESGAIYCYGCKRNICYLCAQVFNHGTHPEPCAHGTGDPGGEIARLRNAESAAGRKGGA